MTDVSKMKKKLTKCQKSKESTGIEGGGALEIVSFKRSEHTALIGVDMRHKKRSTNV